MRSYINLLKEIMKKGSMRENRTGIDTKGINFCYTKFDLEFGRRLPILTTKRVPFKSVLGELLGFIRGTDNASTFRKLGCNIWDANANSKGIDEAHPNAWLTNPTRKATDHLGRIYGFQWRKWEDTKIRNSDVKVNAYYKEQGYKEIGQFLVDGKMQKVWSRNIDQLANVVNTLRTNPTDRRAIITAWNPGDMNEMALPPCHLLQHYLCEKLSTEERLEAHITKFESAEVWNTGNTEGVRDKIKREFAKMEGTDEEKLDHVKAPVYKIDLFMYQRSADAILGVPYNITSYGMLLIIMGRLTGYAPGSLYYATGDTHIYRNHFDATNEQINRTPIVDPVRFIINPRFSKLADFEAAIQSDFRLLNYQNLGPLKHSTPMAV